MTLSKIKVKVKTITTSTVLPPVVKRDRSTKAQKERLVVLDRDNYQCVMCKERGLVVMAEEVDHIIPIADGGPDTMDNKQALCKTCHKAKTVEENRGRGGVNRCGL